MSTILYHEDSPASVINAALLKHPLRIGFDNEFELVASTRINRHYDVVGHINARFPYSETAKMISDGLVVSLDPESDSEYFGHAVAVTDDGVLVLPINDGKTHIQTDHLFLLSNHQYGKIVTLDKIIDKLEKHVVNIPMKEIAYLHCVYSMALEYLSKPMMGEFILPEFKGEKNIIYESNSLYMKWMSKAKREETSLRLSDEINQYLDTITKVKEIINKDIKVSYKVLLNGELYIVPVYSLDPFMSYWVARYMLLTKTICVNVITGYGQAQMYRVFQKYDTEFEMSSFFKTKHENVYIVQGY